ncbi:hypothetical protein KW782_01460 [Candidatus Parcubacteria bacterium]|nr:hypothetical protein [Candidatus Parcubacteria bacterium]
MPNLQRIKIIWTGLFLITLLAVGTSGFLAYKLWSTGSAQSTQQQAALVVKAVGQLMVLPQGEEPTVATVSDPEALKEQTFFTKAKKGDKVLIYSKAQRVILYDPVADKIIDVAPLNIENPS